MFSCMTSCSFHTSYILRALNFVQPALFQIEMEVVKYDNIMEYKCRGVYPPSMKNRSVRANFRSTCKLYNVVDGKLFRRNKQVLRMDELTEEVNRVHGVLGLEHKCGMRKLENILRQKFDCLGLRPKLLEFCQAKCSVCQLTAAGTVWFLRSIRQFKPLDDTAGREVCRKLGVTYQGVPIVEYRVPFRSPSSVDVISPNGNCVFLALLHGIGGNKDQHELLRAAVFQHMLKHDVTTKLKAIYDDGFNTCLSHRATESPVNANVCGIVIHAAASLLGVDVLIHWESEDGVLEWMLALASLQKRVWADHQLGLRFVNNHVDFISKYK